MIQPPTPALTPGMRLEGGRVRLSARPSEPRLIRNVAPKSLTRFYFSHFILSRSQSVWMGCRAVLVNLIGATKKRYRS